MQYARLIITVLIVIVIVLFIGIYLPGYSRHQELRDKEVYMMNEIERLRQSNVELRKEINLLESDLAHLEKVMRNEMRLVKPGEVIYKIVEEDEEMIPAAALEGENIPE